jgi:hypothetical protein
LHELKDAVFAPFPTDERRIGGAVEQKIANEFPELSVPFA